MVKNSNCFPVAYSGGPSNYTSISSSAPPSNACGQFEPYQPWLSTAHRNAPETDGVYVGLDIRDASNVFIGLGFEQSSSHCYPSSNAYRPAFINISPQTSAITPGAVIQCGGFFTYDNSTAKYLKNSANYQWVEANASSVLTTPNILPSPTGSNHFFGRFQYIPSVYIFGLVEHGVGIKVRLTLQNIEQTISSDFEVLTCSSS